MTARGGQLAIKEGKRVFKLTFEIALSYRREKIEGLKTKIRYITNAYYRRRSARAMFRYLRRLRELRLQVKALYQECVKEGRLEMFRESMTRHPESLWKDIEETYGDNWVLGE